MSLERVINQPENMVYIYGVKNVGYTKIISYLFKSFPKFFPWKFRKHNFLRWWNVLFDIWYCRWTEIFRKYSKYPCFNITKWTKIYKNNTEIWICKIIILRTQRWKYQKYQNYSKYVYKIWYKQFFKVVNLSVQKLQESSRKAGRKKVQMVWNCKWLREFSKRLLDQYVDENCITKRFSKLELR